jgi:molybdenum cofactor guanylyltransferase
MSYIGPFTITALILAGGQGSRLGGRDKGLMPWQGKPVAARLAELLRPFCDELLISCNRNQSEYGRWADRLVGDAVPDYPGPLAGILAGLRHCRGTHLLVVPCDLPRLESSVLEELLRKALATPQRPCLTRTGGDWQPLVSVLPGSALPELEAFWEQGGRAPLRWLLTQPHSILQLPAKDQRLANANHMADWAAGQGG